MCRLTTCKCQITGDYFELAMFTTPFDFFNSSKTALYFSYLEGIVMAAYTRTRLEREGIRVTSGGGFLAFVVCYFFFPFQLTGVANDPLISFQLYATNLGE